MSIEFIIFVEATYALDVSKEFRRIVQNNVFEGHFNP